MTVLELITEIVQSIDYYPNSLLLKSADNSGCVYKWLVRGLDVATRKEIFVELNEAQAELALLDKTVVSYIEVRPAK